MGSGSRYGKLMDTITAKNIEYTGYSAFAEYKITQKISLIGRYDYVDNYIKELGEEFSSVRAGLAYNIFKGNTVMVSYDYQTIGDANKSIVMFTTQLKY